MSQKLQSPDVRVPSKSLAPIFEMGLLVAGNCGPAIVSSQSRSRCWKGKEKGNVRLSFWRETGEIGLDFWRETRARFSPSEVGALEGNWRYPLTGKGKEYTWSSKEGFPVLKFLLLFTYSKTYSVLGNFNQFLQRLLRKMKLI